MKMYITKENQDALFITDKTDATSTLKVFAVFDGHGDSGTRTSHDLSEFFQSYYTTDTVVHSTEESLINSIRTSIKKATIYIKSKPYNTDYSGSTLNMVTLYSTVKDPIIKIITTNIGDSRCIAISYTNNNVIQLTKDHKPDDTAERERIESKGGEVARVNWANFGPFRVWFKGKNYPGLAMSRSIGDNIAKSIGVINEPDITIYNANALNVKAIVIATDGVWEFMNNNRIRDIVIEYYKADDCKGAAKKIVAEARKLWEVNNKMGIDDITCIVIYFKK
jgi:serine/threonine protein phosphatase PrpC